MKEMKFQKNAFVFMVVSLAILTIAFVINTIVDQFYWQCIPALLYMGICTMERYSKYKLVKMKYLKSVEN